jgi:hypothetical protein
LRLENPRAAGRGRSFSLLGERTEILLVLERDAHTVEDVLDIVRLMWLAKPLANELLPAK